MDVGCDYIRRTCDAAHATLNLDGLLEINGGNISICSDDQRQLIMDVIFKSAIYRLTGRAMRFDEYLLYLQKKNPTATLTDALPSTTEESVTAFLTFV